MENNKQKLHQYLLVVAFSNNEQDFFVLLNILGEGKQKIRMKMHNELTVSCSFVLFLKAI